MCKKNRAKEHIENKYEKQKQKYRKKITDEQKQKCKDYQKQYRENKTDEQKQKMKDYQKEYLKKYNR